MEWGNKKREKKKENFWTYGRKGCAAYGRKGLERKQKARLIDDLTAVLLRAHRHLVHSPRRKLVRFAIEVEAVRGAQVQRLRKEPKARPGESAALCAHGAFEECGVGTRHQSGRGDAAHDHVVDPLKLLGCGRSVAAGKVVERCERGSGGSGSGGEGDGGGA